MCSLCFFFFFFRPSLHNHRPLSDFHVIIVESSFIPRSSHAEGQLNTSEGVT